MQPDRYFIYIKPRSELARKYKQKQFVCTVYLYNNNNSKSKSNNQEYEKQTNKQLLDRFKRKLKSRKKETRRTLHIRM